MHPFVESNLAACRKHMEQANDALETAIRVGGTEAWGHILDARMRLVFALGELQAASALTKLQNELAATAGEAGRE